MGTLILAQKHVFLKKIIHFCHPAYDFPVFKKFQQTLKYSLSGILSVSVRFFKNNEKNEEIFLKKSSKKTFFEKNKFDFYTLIMIRLFSKSFLKPRNIQFLAF